MGTLPIPGEIFFTDFSDDLVSFKVIRNSIELFTVKGLIEKQKYIFFPFGTDIQPGDKLVSSHLTCNAVHIETENYAGKPSLISVFF
jgi:hypothetical protein|nr:MAG TPA: hypothetical protein [Caudoviricetes sp.]